MDTEIGNKIRELEVIQKGLSAKLEQLLRWGGLILSEVENTQNKLKEAEKELDGLMGLQDYSLAPYTKAVPEVKSMDLHDNIRHTVLSALEQAKGNKAEAARILGISRRAFLRKAKEYGVPNGEYFGPKKIKKGDEDDSSKDGKDTED